MSHRNARTTLHGRMLIVQRHQQGWKQAHIAAAMGISRKCVHTWISRYPAEGEVGLQDRSSRPYCCPTKTSARVERQVIAAGRRHRRGQDWLGPELGIAARTVGRILHRRGEPYLRDCDPMTGAVIKASKATALRYQRDRPSELVHVDVKKLGRIPDRGGWRAHGRSQDVRGRGIGYDYVHSMVDDHSRLVYSEIHADEKGPTCAGFIARAAEYFQSQGISRIERVITDNHLSYRRLADVAAIIDGIHAKHIFIEPHCPWQNGKVERYNRTLQSEWSYRRVFTSNADRARALAPWVEFYNTQRRHSALDGQPPISRLRPT